MLFDKYELYDIHYALVMFRYKPLYEHNTVIAKKIKEKIDAPQVGNCVDINIIRKELAKIEPLRATDEWHWVGRENIYTYGQTIVHNAVAYQILSVGFEELLYCMKEQNEKRICDLADALHNVPIILTEHHKKNEKKIVSEISSYRKKWNNDFLKDILKK